MSRLKRAERARRTLSETEISHLRFIRAVGTSRELLDLVERIVADRRAAADV